MVSGGVRGFIFSIKSVMKSQNVWKQENMKADLHVTFYDRCCGKKVPTYIHVAPKVNKCFHWSGYSLFLQSVYGMENCVLKSTLYFSFACFLTDGGSRLKQ